MSKKHFRALAEAIASIADKAERERVCDLVGGVCIGCNGRFCWYTFCAPVRWRLTYGNSNKENRSGRFHGRIPGD